MIVLASYVKVQFYRELHKAKCNKKEVLLRDSHECQYCGAHATTVDHIVPISKGGQNTWSNLVAACAVRLRGIRSCRGCPFLCEGVAKEGVG